MTDADVTYYARRADFEHERALQATCPEVIRAHQIIATVYRDRIAAARQQSTQHQQVDHV